MKRSGCSGWGRVAFSPHTPLSSSEDIDYFEVGHTNVAFRFGVSQGKKLRPCGDLRHNLVNSRTAILSPITLPTWDHLAQMGRSVFSSVMDWGFLKGDHASAYKQLPIDPSYANLSVVALRNPKSVKLMGFAPRVLLFGAVQAVLHYNCFPRCLAVLVNRCLGIPLVNYYDDFGAFCPASIYWMPQHSFLSFRTL